MSVAQLYPHLGDEEMKVGTDGLVFANFAAVMEVARLGDTEEARAFYRAGMEKWRALEGSPLSKGERDRLSIEAACAAIGAQVVPYRSEPLQ